MSKYNLMYLKILEVTDFPLLAIIALVTTFTSVNWEESMIQMNFHLYPLYALLRTVVLRSTLVEMIPMMIQKNSENGRVMVI